jgi:ribosomal protein S18 acetylase RimI-like enzyme
MLEFVGKVSNFLAKAAQPGLPQQIDCRMASETDRHEALRLLLSSGDKVADDSQVEQFIRFAQQRSFRLEHLWIACENRRLLWAMLPIISPGKSALLFTPSGFFHAEAASRLIDAAARWGAAQGLDLYQLLLDPGLGDARAVFEEQHFQLMAELRYLQSPVRAREIAPQLGVGMTWESYSAGSHERFAGTILASYRESLDCPRLAGMRNIEDVIAGHKASGEFDPRCWFLLHLHSRPVAVLLINKVGGAEQAELTYLGVSFEARRMGLGSLLVRQAMVTAATMKAKLLTLAVDSANAPALRLYFRHGFRHMGSKLALMRDLRKC